MNGIEGCKMWKGKLGKEKELALACYRPGNHCTDKRTSGCLTDGPPQKQSDIGAFMVDMNSHEQLGKLRKYTCSIWLGYQDHSGPVDPVVRSGHVIQVTVLLRQNGSCWLTDDPQTLQPKSNRQDFKMGKLIGLHIYKTQPRVTNRETTQPTVGNKKTEIKSWFQVFSERGVNMYICSNRHGM